MSIKLDRGNVFDKPGNWYKGNLHLHTTKSDGKTDPDTALRWHKDNDYDFVCFGDHWHVTEPRDPEGKILVIPGCEIDTWTDGTIGNTHIMCVGVDGIKGDFRPRNRAGVRELWDWATRISDYRWIAHPYWSTQSAESLKSYPGLKAIEVFNGLFDTTLAMGDGEYPWHMLLNEGVRIDALAVDDAHGGAESMGKGWIMVKAMECTRPAIIAALHAGDFYATRGPGIASVEFTDKSLIVRTTPAKRIIVRTNQFFGGVWTARGGEGDSIVVAEAKIDLNEMNHIRIVVEDHQGRKAWSNPFYFTDTKLQPKRRIEVAGEPRPQPWG